MKMKLVGGSNGFKSNQGFPQLFAAHDCGNIKSM